MLNYWQKPRRRYSPRSGSSLGQSRSASKEERWRERFYGAKGRCPKCGTWRFQRLLSDTWSGQRKVRLQCECGWCWTHDAPKHDQLLIRTSGSGARGTYRPLGYKRFQADEKFYYD